MYCAPLKSVTVDSSFAGHANVGTDETLLEAALEVMPAIDMETVNDMELIGPLEATTALMLVWDVDWFMYNGFCDADELAEQEPYVL